MLKIAIIIGSTRPGRNGEAVAKWVHEIAQKRSDAEFELVDIKDFNLPLLDEPVPAAMGNYSKPHTKAWGAKIDSFDGYVFVTPEYNHGMNGALKNAIDFLYREWNNKAAGFVGYGGAGAARAVSQLRTVMAYLQVATVQNQVQLSLMTDFENFNVFKPANPEIFVVGDTASLDQDGKPLGGVAQVAMQQGHYAGKLIRRRVAGKKSPKPFRYFDKGNMAVVGKGWAVLESGKIHIHGLFAWLAWAFIHVTYLAQLSQRISVFLQWGWLFLTGQRGSRLIVNYQQSEPEQTRPPSPATADRGAQPARLETTLTK